MKTTNPFIAAVSDQSGEVIQLVTHKDNYLDSYHGAREDMEIWKKRALEAEAKLKKYND